MYEYTGKVTKVVDGDTIDCIVDLGFNILTNQRFRLLEINSPEICTEEGIEAKAALNSKIFGKVITIKSHKKDKYGRWLATIYLDGENINEWLIINKFADRV